MEEVKYFASKVGIAVFDDEVDIGGRWDDVFEVVETGARPHARILRFTGLKPK